MAAPTPDGLAAAGALGIETVDIGPGRSVVRLRVRPDMLNSHGTCHGGVIFTLADVAFELACNAGRPTTVAAGASIEFVASAAADTELTATCEQHWREGRNGVYDVTVVAADGTVVALFRGRARTVGDGAGR